LLANGFEIFGEESLESAQVTRAAPTLSLNVSSGIDWFDVQAVIRFGEIDVDLKEIRRALRRRKRYVKLADGTIGELPDEWVAKYKHLFGLAEISDDGFRVSRHHITLIDELLEEVETSHVDSEFRRQLEKLRDFSGIQENRIPKDFTGELRPYQKAGFDWIHFLKDYRFGGILADDMGLGKTVQVLAFLQSISENGSRGKANLVVVPRSLLVNWQREAQRFTPVLRLYEHFGPDRLKRTDSFPDFDIILTTYGIMRRDIQLLRTYNFNHIVLDESQAIKNPVSQVSKASRLLVGNHKLALTGTPVENSTFELWSQFAFLNPGLLGGLDYFKREFGNPIERRQDQDTADFLRSMVYPFILRRTKGQVAPELPPREEQVLYTDMEPAQRKFYERTRDYYRGMLLGMIQDNGINDSRMKILEGLLRLRQISNHPRLVEPDFRGRSAKLTLLLEQLETLQAEGHKALIFSQFVQMLKLVRVELDNRRIPYEYLDGQTRKRQERVDAFQSNPDVPFFLISLKAGGVGLNLTAADYVIHIDPWWNPAVEMQATDRTHRIGQDKPVFVYKMITRDSVEEKILTLQERKKALIDQLITTESSFFKDLTQSDVEVLFS
jgi:non-specific serine/threonine protein kinase